MGKIIGRIEHYYVVSLFFIMILFGAILWISLFLHIFIKSDILNLITLSASIMLVFFYFFLTGNSFVFSNKISNDKICDFIESTNHSRFFAIITFTLYNSLLLEIFLIAYESPISYKTYWSLSYLPIANIFTYINLTNRYLKNHPNYSFSKLFSLYMQGRLILLFIKEAKRISY